jgi:transferase CAF17, mitochondrial
MDAFTRITNRHLLRIHGTDTLKLLQSLTTQQMNRIQNGGPGVYAAFLSPQGRLQFDTFIYPQNNTPNSLIIECDSQHSTLLQSHLNRYKLRNQVTIQESDGQLWQAWGPSTHDLCNKRFVPPASKPLSIGSVVPMDMFCQVGCKDPRHPDMGLRFVLPPNEQRKK